MKKALAYIFVMVVAFASSTTLSAYTPTTVPNPKNAYQDNFVSNPDGILTAQAEAQINEIARDLRKNAEVELAVVAIKEMETDFFGDEFDFCQKLFNFWGIGGKKNQGVLLFLDLGSRAVRIHTGGGLEGLLPDATCDLIIDQMMPDLQNGDYSFAMLTGTRAIQTILTTESALAELLLDDYHRKESNDWVFDYLIFCMFVFMFLVRYSAVILNWNPSASNNVRYAHAAGSETLMWLSGVLFAVPCLLLALWFHSARRGLRTRPVTCPDCHKKMKLLSEAEEDAFLSSGQQAEEKVGSIDYDVWHCSCGNNIILPYNNAQTKYTACPRCAAKTYYLHADVVRRGPTTLREGQGEKIYKCSHCGYATSVLYAIPRLPVVVASGGSGHGGSGGGFSGGSWGGGMSFGGGAGRHF